MTHSLRSGSLRLHSSLLLPFQPNDYYTGEDCVHGEAPGCLNDLPCDVTSAASQPMAACCEVPSTPVPGAPCTSCPAGFSNLDSSGFCYSSRTGATWDGALASCRSANSAASLAVVYDAATASSVISGRCSGLFSSAQNFWIGMRDNDPSAAPLPHTNRSGAYWRWMGSGAVNRWLATSGTSYWYAGMRECSIDRCCALPQKIHNRQLRRLNSARLSHTMNVFSWSLLFACS